MSESVLADFTARAIYTDTFQAESEPCRVILNREQLAVVSQGQHRQIPLSSIFDVIVSRVPSELDEFFDQSVLIGYTKQEQQRTVLVEGDHEHIDRFAMFLYKATLQGTHVRVKHPARKGGRLVDSPVQSADIALMPQAVTFKRESDSFSIDLSMVTNIEYAKRTFEETTKPVLSVRHMADQQALTTEIAHDSERKLNILARYLRLRYFRLEEELRELEITDREAAGLVALYSGGSPEAIGTMLEVEPETVEPLLEGLVEKQLIEDTDGELTDRGRMVVSDRIDEINI